MITRTPQRLALALLALALTACSTDPDTTKPAPAPSTSPPAPPAPITFETTTMTLKGKTFSIEVALSEEQHQLGLMNRTTLPEDHGMLFVMSKPDKWSFWMHNTRIPLDIVFLDSTGKVIDIHNRKPNDEEGRGPDAPALYIIELLNPTANKIGLKKGDSIEIPKKYVKN